MSYGTDAIQDVIASADTPFDAREAIKAVFGITKQDARHVLYHFGDKKHGLAPGDFEGYLLKAMSHADLGNLTKTVAAFPELGNAFLIAAHMPGGMEFLVAIATER